jgi:hypothetical protein
MFINPIWKIRTISIVYWINLVDAQGRNPKWYNSNPSPALLPSVIPQLVSNYIKERSLRPWADALCLSKHQGRFIPEASRAFFASDEECFSSDQGVLPGKLRTFPVRNIASDLYERCISKRLCDPEQTFFVYRNRERSLASATQPRERSASESEASGFVSERKVLFAGRENLN